MDFDITPRIGDGAHVEFNVQATEITESNLMQVDCTHGTQRRCAYTISI